MQLGDTINGEAAGDYSGTVSLSADGNTVAIGAYGNDGNGVDSGHVRVYTLQSDIFECTAIIPSLLSHFLSISY